ncbi:MAG TPA: hypothetical protein VLM16_02495, partial [Ginsengibacter sp.]|nr:hypothetical protein [Ginsengibacter sp.]
MKKTIVMLLIVTTITNTNLIAQTWNGSVSNDWNTAANWTPANVPTSSGNVIINNAAASYQPALAGSVNIASLAMSSGILNLHNFTITCSGNAVFTGDSVLNGKVIANTFNNVANMHIGGKFILEKTGPSNEFWSGNNKFYGDSLIIIWRWGALHLENAASSPDSLFGNLKVQLADNYSVGFSLNSPLYVQKDLILDNTGNGTFFMNYANSKIIGGNLIGQNFASATPDLQLQNITTLGNNANGPFYSHLASINNCNFNGNFTLVADSNVAMDIHNSSLSGADNLLQAGNLDVLNNKFGKPGNGTTILRAAHNLGYNVLMRDGNNKFIGNVQWETYAVYPGGLTIQQTFYGADTCLGNMSYILKGNAALTTNSNGHSYVAGNVIIDGQGTSKWVQFTGGAGISFNVVGNFTVKNFTPFYEPGVTSTNVYLRNLTVGGTNTVGTFYCYTGDINNSIFNGKFKLIADSSQAYFISNSSFLGADNLFQAGITQAQNDKFGHIGPGMTILRSALSSGSNFMRDGNNKFYNNAQWETYAIYPAGVTIQQNYFGVDTCLGNMSFILKGNSALITNGSGNNYVAGNVTIDGHGARKWVEFTGGTGNNFYVGGNFTVKNFTAFAEAGVGNTYVFLRNLFVSGTDTVGTFYCTTGDVTNSSFNGNIKFIADSNQTYVLNYSSFLGANNLFQSGNLDFHDNKFGQGGIGSTILRASYNGGGSFLMRDGLNKFFGNVQWETYALYPGSTTIQQNYYGADSCWGNMSFILKGNSYLTTNGNGNNYVAGNVVIDGQGARKWVQFTGGTGNTFNVGGNFTVKNFSPAAETGVGHTNVYLRNLFVTGTDTVGTFHCITGDINNSIFHGNFKLIADSIYVFALANSSFLGADNYFQSGSLDVQNNKMGQTNLGTTILKTAQNGGGLIYMRDGNNKFFGDAQWLAIAPPTGSTYFQQTFYGPDSCLGNLTVRAEGAAGVNLAGNNLYIGKGLSLQNNGSGTIVHDNGSSAIYFIGADTANYSYSGSGAVPSLRNIG